MKSKLPSCLPFAALVATLTMVTATQAQVVRPGQPGGTSGPVVACQGYAGSCDIRSARPINAYTSGAYVTQVGEGNTATITQRQGSTSSVASATQTGDRNFAVIDQNATSAYADVTQTGDANQAFVSQKGIGSNTLYLDQTGQGNFASVNQMSGSSGHTASLQQTGSRNTMNVNQLGDGNSASLEQNGNDNLMLVEQLGSNNALTWVQDGNGLSRLIISMDGNGDAMSIHQSNPSGQR